MSEDRVGHSALAEAAERTEGERALRMLRAAHRFTQEVLGQDDPHELAATIVEAVAHELDVRGAALALAWDEGHVLTLAHERGCHPDEIALIDPLNLRRPGPSPGKDAILAGRALIAACSGDPILLAPIVIPGRAGGSRGVGSGEAPADTGPLAARRPGSIAGLDASPLVGSGGDRTIGILLATSPSSGRFSEDDLAWLESVRTPLCRALDAALRSVALSRSREALERVNREFRDMVRDLSVANDKLKELDRLKDLFVSSVSHELRTPLTSIRGFAEILLDYGTDDPKISREFLTIIRDESDRLGRLIRNILDLSRLEAGGRPLDKAPVQLVEIVSAASSILKSQLEADGRRFEVRIGSDLPSALGDRDGLVQVLVNLLGNAAKFTRPGGLIRVSAISCGPDGAAEGSGALRIDVSDDGIGIPAVEQERIFERFQRIESDAVPKTAGTGLGLAICKEILGHLGGRIWLESEEGRGSTFRFTVPAREVAS